MSHVRNHFRLLLALGALLIGGAAAEAAGLVGYRNDTQQAVVVQSTVVSNGMVRRSRPQTLYPGEVARDSLAFTGPRTIKVYDAKKPTAELFSGEISSTEDVVLSIRVKTTAPIKGQPAAPPRIEVVKVAPPAVAKSRK